ESLLTRDGPRARAHHAFGGGRPLADGRAVGSGVCVASKPLAGDSPEPGRSPVRKTQPAILRRIGRTKGESRGPALLPSLSDDLSGILRSGLHPPADRL